MCTLPGSSEQPAVQGPSVGGWKQGWIDVGRTWYLLFQKHVESGFLRGSERFVWLLLCFCLLFIFVRIFEVICGWSIDLSGQVLGFVRTASSQRAQEEVCALTPTFRQVCWHLCRAPAPGSQPRSEPSTPVPPGQGDLGLNATAHAQLLLGLFLALVAVRRVAP